MEQIQALSGWSTPAQQNQNFRWREAVFSLLHLTPGPSKTQMLTGCSPKIFLWGPHLLLLFHSYMFKSVMFIYRSLYYSVIAASGKGPSLLRVLSSLQKLLLSQRRDSRLNNQFPITVTVWEQLFAAEGLPAIVRGALKQRRNERMCGGEGKMKGKFFSAWFSPLKGLDIDLTNRPADVYV